MNAEVNTTEEGNKRNKPKWYNRVLGFLPFPAVVTASFLLLCCFPLWMSLDASYRLGFYFSRINLGLETFDAHPSATAIGLTDLILDLANEWDALGSRVKLFYLLYLLTGTSWVLVIIHLCRKRTIGRIAVVSLLVASWIGLFYAHSRLTHWAVQRHVTVALPKFKAVAIALQSDWPKASGRVPPDLDVLSVPDKYPNYLWVQGRQGYPMDEDIGYEIERWENGTLRFALRVAADYKLEYHPSGSQPSSYTTLSSEQRAVMSDWNQLEENWYLVRY